MCVKGTAVILAASIFDNSLTELLKIYLTPNSSSTDDLFDGPNAPFSSFNSRIAIAYRLGLTSSKFTNDLHLIRKIRNEFAHNIHGCSFEDSRVKSRTLELYKETHKTRIEPYRKNFPEGIRGDFMAVCSWMLWSLNVLVEHCVQTAEANPEFGYKKRSGK